MPIRKAVLAIAALAVEFYRSVRRRSWRCAPRRRRSWSNPSYNWTGFYIGGNVGYGWGNADTFFNPLPSAVAFVNLAPTTLGLDPQGVVGGVQAGYNWQAGKFVLWPSKPTSRHRISMATRC